MGRRALWWIIFCLGGGAFVLGASALLGFIWMFIANNDLYGRLSETASMERFYHAGAGTDLPVPTVRVVLHRLLTDENAIEASVVLTMDRQLWESFARRGVKSLTAVLRDVSLR